MDKVSKVLMLLSATGISACLYMLYDLFNTIEPINFRLFLLPLAGIAASAGILVANHRWLRKKAKRVIILDDQQRHNSAKEQPDE